MFCMACGTFLPDDAAFCLKCGKKVDWEQPVKKDNPSETGMRIIACTSCGSRSLKTIRLGEYLCEHCGSRFITNDKNTNRGAEEQEAEIYAFMAKASEYKKQKDYQKELETLAKALDKAPDNLTLLLRLGDVYSRLGYPEKSLEYYRKAEKLDPDDPAVYANIGVAAFSQGNYVMAKSQYEKALDMVDAKPTSMSNSDLAITYGNYSWCIGKLGDIKGAIKYLSLAKARGLDTKTISTICSNLHLNTNEI